MSKKRIIFGSILTISLVFNLFIAFQIPNALKKINKSSVSVRDITTYEVPVENKSIDVKTLKCSESDILEALAFTDDFFMSKSYGGGYYVTLEYSSGYEVNLKAKTMDSLFIKIKEFANTKHNIIKQLEE